MPRNSGHSFTKDAKICGSIERAIRQPTTACAARNPHRLGRMTAPLTPQKMAASIGPTSSAAGNWVNSRPAASSADNPSRKAHCTVRDWRASNSGEGDAICSMMWERPCLRTLTACPYANGPPSGYRIEIAVASRQCLTAMTPVVAENAPACRRSGKIDCNAAAVDDKIGGIGSCRMGLLGLGVPAWIAVALCLAVSPAIAGDRALIDFIGYSQ